MPAPPFHPDLRAARWLPRSAAGPRMLAISRVLGRFASTAPRLGASVVTVEPGVSVRVFRPADAGNGRDPGRRPAVLWIHGGGYVVGSARQDDPFCRRLADELGAVVVAVDYRLAPEHPFPTPLDDCAAALRWLARETDVDPDRIAVAGASAGGGLAAATTLLAVERDDVHPAFQLLVYPMLDDRTVQRTDVDPRTLRVWSPASNRFGWRAYLGPDQDAAVPPLAAPARYTDLAALPPTWIGVGTRDLFHDEDVAYAERLRAAGVPCELEVIEGAYHGFDTIQPRAGVSREFRRSQVDALARGVRATTR